MSFGAIADDYNRLRPPPAEGAVDWLVPPDCEVAVDLAAGTGLLSRALAGRAGQVIAVEPDERMAAVLRACSPGVRVMDGRGEAIPLPDASADGVFASSAWHWLDPALAVPEISRVLRDGGRLGVLWTSIDREAGWLQTYRRSGARRGAGTGNGGRGERLNRVVLPDDAPLRDVATQLFRFTRRMAAGSLLELFGTYSNMITADAQDRDAALAYAARALAERYPGASEIDVPMASWCWRADRTSRP